MTRPIVPEDIRNGNRARDAAVASLTRACIATGLGALDKTIRLSDLVRRWDDYRSIDLIMRAATSRSLTNTTALTAIAGSFLEVLTPVSAGADLLDRSIKWQPAANLTRAEEHRGTARRID